MTSGELLERKQRRRFWMNLAVVAIPTAPLGFVVGNMMGREDKSMVEAVASLSPNMATLLVASFVAMMVIGSYLFFRSVDEVEMEDNLWGSLTGYYAYMVLFPAWWVLGTAGVTAPVSNWTIYAIALFSGAGCYFWRKWRAR